MRLKDVVDSNDQLKSCWKQGIHALSKKDKKYIKVRSGACEGSIDIDHCLENNCPQDNRWDYGLDMENKGVFVEIHPAHSSEVRVVLDKLQWLKSYFRNNCNGFEQLSKSFHWVASGTIAIRRGSRYEKQLAKAGLNMPIRQLDL